MKDRDISCFFTCCFFICRSMEILVGAACRSLLNRSCFPVLWSSLPICGSKVRKHWSIQEILDVGHDSIVDDRSLRVASTLNHRPALLPYEISSHVWSLSTQQTKRKAENGSDVECSKESSVNLLVIFPSLSFPCLGWDNRWQSTGPWGLNLRLATQLQASLETKGQGTKNMLALWILFGELMNDRSYGWIQSCCFMDWRLIPS